MLRFCILLALTGGLLRSETNPRVLIDRLPQTGLQSAFQVLRRDYIRREDLSFEELNRAALQGLLERLSFSAQLVPVDQKAPSLKPGVHLEFLAPDIAYLRPETLAEGEGSIFEKSLVQVAERKSHHLILDLRAATHPGIFEEASLVLQCFVPQGEVMFKLKHIGREDAELFISRREPLWTSQVVVLVDEETGSAAEAVAAVLQHRKLALIMGGPTRGAAVLCNDVRLDENTALRYASAEMLLPDGRSIFKKGIKPDFLTVQNTDAKHKVVEASREHSILPFVMDRVRPRFNEAALVRGQNPELDDYVHRTAGRPLPGDEGQLRDLVIQRALDLLRADDFLLDAHIPWNEKAMEPDPIIKAPRAEPVKP